MMITTTEELKNLCERLAKSDMVAVDTEFIRQYTYWPMLCLVQIADDNESACIDPLADGIDLAPLFELMENPNVLKVFHSARQDLEIFYHLMGKVPSPLFDTQVGATVCGLGESVSYQHLVSTFLKISIDKSVRYTDWSKRPLTESQIKYALSDVIHLVPAYRRMAQMLQDNNRLDWVRAEMDELLDKNLYEPDPMTVWQKVKYRSDNPTFLSVLQHLCAWRERKALAENKARPHVAKDEILLEIAASKPKSCEDLGALRTVTKSLKKEPACQEILNAIQAGLQTPDEQKPRPLQHLQLSAKQKSTADLLDLLLTIVCARADVAPRLVASMDDLKKIAKGDENVPAMAGWRYDVFGKYAQDFKKGKTAICLNPKTGLPELIENH